MVLIKARCIPQLPSFRRAGFTLTPEYQILECTDDQAKALETDTRSVIAVRVTPEEAAAFRTSAAKATSDPASLASENVALANRCETLEARVAELEDALRRLIEEKGGGPSDFGDEPSARGGGVKPSIAPGRAGKARSEG